tara:strand:+ start:261 stop:428 length:168 start_codon:yes stop_codon:yes gene_type:complete
MSELEKNNSNGSGAVQVGSAALKFNEELLSGMIPEGIGKAKLVFTKSGSVVGNTG